ncbi:hypothetical protein BESB_081880 [Besnoitia besnoiti]|uniref:Uncharacterized protein n=1 Tax=Besnoitia besnoiti TaxID=94643 RepID=A0A2A9M4W4_BESBE|nr:hypothetical protein BESB_081880 [Besnoitia besnoiti]PFH32989.1 hypothetical protein BESB_081880 [Besnoitia besnoiti]
MPAPPLRPRASSHNLLPSAAAHAFPPYAAPVLPVGGSGTVFYRPGPAPTSCRTSHLHGEVTGKQSLCGTEGQPWKSARRDSRAAFEGECATAAFSPLLPGEETRGRAGRRERTCEGDHQEGESSEPWRTAQSADPGEDGGRRGGLSVLSGAGVRTPGGGRHRDFFPSFHFESGGKENQRPANAFSPQGQPEGEATESPSLSAGPCLLRSRPGNASPLPETFHGSSVCTPRPSPGGKEEATSGHRFRSANDFLASGDAATAKPTSFGPAFYAEDTRHAAFPTPSNLPFSSSPSYLPSAADAPQPLYPEDEQPLYQRVRLQLLSLQYTEKFDPVNTRLVSRLLQDVVKAVENFQLLMKKYKDLQAQCLSEREASLRAEPACARFEAEAKEAKERTRGAERAQDEKAALWEREKKEKAQTIETLRGLLARAREDRAKIEEKLKQQEVQGMHARRFQSFSRSPSRPRRSLSSVSQRAVQDDRREKNEGRSEEGRPFEGSKKDDAELRLYRQLTETLQKKVERIEKQRKEEAREREAKREGADGQDVWKEQLREKEEECRTLTKRLAALDARYQALKQRAAASGLAARVEKEKVKESDTRRRSRVFRAGEEAGSESCSPADSLFFSGEEAAQRAQPEPAPAREEGTRQEGRCDGSEERERGESDCAKMEAEIAALVAQAADLQTREQEAATEATKWQATARAESEARREAEQQVEGLTKRVEALQREIDEARGRLAAAGTEGGNSASSRFPENSELGQLRERLHAVQGALEREQVRSAQKDLLIGRLEVALTEIREQVKSIVERNEALQDQVRSKTEAAIEMEKKAELQMLRLDAAEPARERKEAFPEVSSLLPSSGRGESVEAEVAQLEQQVSRLSQLLAAVEKNRGSEVRGLTAQLVAAENKIMGLEKEASQHQRRESLRLDRELERLREELLLSDRERDSLRKELEEKEEAAAAMERLVAQREKEKSAILSDFEKSREAAAAEREAVTSRAEQVESHLQEIRIERDLLQQRIAEMRSEVEALSRVSEENRALAGEAERLQRTREELEEQLRSQRLAHEQVIQELQSMQTRQEQTMALCSELTLERSEAVEAAETHERRVAELEAELALMAERQHQVLQELAATQRAQRQAEEDYFVLLRKMENLTEQIASAPSTSEPASLLHWRSTAPSLSTPQAL